MNNGQINPDAPSLYTSLQLLSWLFYTCFYTCFKIYTHYVCSQKSMLYDCLSVNCLVCMSSHVKEDFLLRQTIKFLNLNLISYQLCIFSAGLIDLR